MKPTYTKRYQRKNRPLARKRDKRGEDKLSLVYLPKK